MDETIENEELFRKAFIGEMYSTIIKNKFLTVQYNEYKELMKGMTINSI